MKRLPKYVITTFLSLTILTDGMASAQVDSISEEQMWGAETIAQYGSLLHLNDAPQNTYATRELSEIAKELQASGNVIHQGTHPLKNSNVTYEVLTDNFGMIKHIGTKLFSEEMKLNFENYSMIFYFIERTNLYLRLLAPQTRKIVADALGLEFVDSEFFGINANNSANIDIQELTDERKYIFRWNDKDGKKLCELKFPKSYALISGFDISECQVQLEKEIRSWTASSELDSMYVNPDKLMRQGDIFVLKGEKYILETINSNKFYADSKGTTPVNTGHHPLETFANIFSRLIPTNIDVSVSQNMYGFKTSDYKIKLSDMIDYFYANRCKPYFGTETHSDSEIKAMVIFENIELCYIHLLVISARPEVIAAGQGTATATLHCFIPTHNLKSLFGELDETKKK